MKKKLIFLIMFQFHTNRVQTDTIFTPVIKTVYSLRLCCDGRISFYQKFKGIYIHLPVIFFK